MKFKLNKKKKSGEIKNKEERFKIVAGRRVQNILNQMRLLRNCTHRGNYSYSDEQINKIIRTIDEEWKHVKSEFVKKKSKNKGFSL
tara:strand:+ start:217 stop:474 length:258 start_codon:yes stop_codon:yes gene_type:complete